MGRAYAFGVFLGGMCLGAPHAVADTIYTNQLEWLAAVSAFGPVRNLSLTPAAVPDTGGAFVDDEGTLSFPDNHGGMAVLADGWFGDVHTGIPRPDDHEPNDNRFEFARPVSAFAATVTIGQDIAPEIDSILLSFGGGATHRLMFEDYSPGFFGWVGDAPAGDLRVGSGAGSHFYWMTDMQYVLPPVAAAPAPAEAVPLPPAVWGGFVLVALVIVRNRQRRTV